jgi:hypothetical protein
MLLRLRHRGTIPGILPFPLPPQGVDLLLDLPPLDRIGLPLELALEVLLSLGPRSGADAHRARGLVTHGAVATAIELELDVSGLHPDLGHHGGFAGLDRGSVILEPIGIAGIVEAPGVVHLEVDSGLGARHRQLELHHPAFEVLLEGGLGLGFKGGSAECTGEEGPTTSQHRKSRVVLVWVGRK